MRILVLKNHVFQQDNLGIFVANVQIMKNMSRAPGDRMYCNVNRNATFFMGKLNKSSN